MTANIYNAKAEAASKVRVVPASWQAEQTALMHIRTLVFMQEQQVSAALEWDGLDATAAHLLALTDADEPIGCARLLAASDDDVAVLGRMAVLKDWRGLGVGNRLLQTALAIYRQQGVRCVCLSAQTHAIDFYAQAGFVVTSGVYLDADIPHVDMQRVIETL